LNKISTADLRGPLALVVVCLALFLPICFLTPCYYGDDGGYMQMLNFFMQSGKVDLMQWSQPTAIGLLFAGVLAAKCAGFGFVQLDLVGLLFSIAAVLGLYRLFRARAEAGLSFVLALSIFCFCDAALVAPTFMTDMPFLAYCAWWLVFTQKVLSSEGPVKPVDYVLWCLFLLLAFLTRSTILLALPALLIAALFCASKRRVLLVMAALFIGCGVVASGITKLLTINALTFFQTTALREIVQLHDFARFNIREAAVATLCVIFSASPLLLAVNANSYKRLFPARIISAAVAAVLACYFSAKGLFQPLGTLLSVLVIPAVTCAAYNAPVVVADALRNNKALALILLTFLVASLGVLPIMAHPLTRHAIPAMVAMIGLVSLADCYKTGTEKYVFALVSLLLLNNVIMLQQQRLSEFARLAISRDLQTLGVKPTTIDAGWAWFCYEGLIPGSNDQQSYVEKFKNWQKDASFTVGPISEAPKDGRLLSEFAVPHFTHKIDVSVVQAKSSKVDRY
jgi:hypothetical protein